MPDKENEQGITQNKNIMELQEDVEEQYELLREEVEKEEKRKTIILIIIFIIVLLFLLIGAFISYKSYKKSLNSSSNNFGNNAEIKYFNIDTDGDGIPSLL